MAIFSYEAVDKTGKKIKSEIEAVTIQEAVNKIRKMGYFPMNIKGKSKSNTGSVTSDATESRSHGQSKKFSLSNLFAMGGVSGKHLTQFTHQLAVLQGAGIPLLRSLHILGDQLKTSPLKNVINEISDDVESGNSLSEAMAKHPKVFDRLYVNMIKAGEVGGLLDKILARLAMFMGKTQSLKRKVIGALIYPAVVISVAVIIMAIIMTQVIPQFEKVFLELAGKQGLPPLTELVLGIARFVQHTWFLIPLIPVVVYLVGILVIRSDKGRLFIDRLKLRLPLVGIIIRKSTIVRFCQTLGTLLASGVPILEALNIVRNAVGNRIISDAIQKTHDAIREGGNLAGTLALSGVFEDMVIDMIEVGEETGQLDEMLMKIAEVYEEDVDVLISSLTSILEPVIIIVLGVVVGFIVVALFMPLVSLMQSIGTV